MCQEYIILQIRAIKFICKFLIFLTSEAEFNLKIIPSFCWKSEFFTYIILFLIYLELCFEKHCDHFQTVYPETLFTLDALFTHYVFSSPKLKRTFIWS